MATFYEAFMKLEPDQINKLSLEEIGHTLEWITHLTPQQLQEKYVKTQIYCLTSRKAFLEEREARLKAQEKEKEQAKLAQFHDQNVDLRKRIEFLTDQREQYRNQKEDLQLQLEAIRNQNVGNNQLNDNQQPQVLQNIAAQQNQNVGNNQLNDNQQLQVLQNIAAQQNQNVGNNQLNDNQQLQVLQNIAAQQNQNVGNNQLNDNQQLQVLQNIAAQQNQNVGNNQLNDNQQLQVPQDIAPQQNRWIWQREGHEWLQACCGKNSIVNFFCVLIFTVLLGFCILYFNPPVNSMVQISPIQFGEDVEVNGVKIPNNQQNITLSGQRLTIKRSNITVNAENKENKQTLKLNLRHEVEDGPIKYILWVFLGIGILFFVAQLIIHYCPLVRPQMRRNNQNNGFQNVGQR